MIDVKTTFDQQFLLFILIPNFNFLSFLIHSALPEAFAVEHDVNWIYKWIQSEVRASEESSRSSPGVCWSLAKKKNIESQ